MKYRILGALDVRSNATRVRVSRGKQQRVLATLLLSREHTATLHKLAQAVWDCDQPATAEKQIRNTVSDLRRTLDTEGPSIEQVAGGYRLHLDETDLDATLFARCLSRARELAAAGQVADAVASYRDGLGLWRGPTLAGLDCALLLPQRTRLNEERLIALIECATLESALGHHMSMVAELSAWHAERPTWERLAGLLMLTLYRCGRQADALQSYERTRTALADLGIEPDHDLQELRQLILTNDTSLALPPPGIGAADLNRSPRDVVHPTGTSTGPADLQQAIAATDAHRSRSGYPDSQLLIDLRGRAPDQEPPSRSAVLDILLRAAGVPTDQIPQRAEDRAALWRAHLADKRILIILDNAASKLIV